MNWPIATSRSSAQGFFSGTFATWHDTNAAEESIRSTFLYALENIDGKTSACVYWTAFIPETPLATRAIPTRKSADLSDPSLRQWNRMERAEAASINVIRSMDGRRYDFPVSTCHALQNHEPRQSLQSLDIARRSSTTSSLKMDSWRPPLDGPYALRTLSLRPSIEIQARHRPSGVS